MDCKRPGRGRLDQRSSGAAFCHVFVAVAVTNGCEEEAAVGLGIKKRLIFGGWEPEVAIDIPRLAETQV